MHYAAEPSEVREATTVSYDIQNMGSTFTVRAFATGLLSSFGHNPTVSIPQLEGEILLNPEAVEQSSLRLAADPASMEVIDEMSDKDKSEINRRMHENVLESESYPIILFQSSRCSASKTGGGQYWVALNGQLTLHGVTRDQTISARVSVKGGTLLAAGEFSLLLSDYEIQPVSALGGAVKLKDEIKLSFSISARKKT